MSKTILIVDDEDDIREIAQLSLELSSGWSVITASSGADGVTRASADKPDAILLDVMMPGLDGPGTIAQLKERASTRDIPVVFLTAKVRPSERERLGALGAVGVLSKPFDPLTLADDVSKLLGWAA